MNATEEHARFAEDVGAYLLGALEDREERSFENHLDVCHLCQEEVARLTVARDALPQGVEQLPPPPELKASLMATVESEAAARHELLAPSSAGRAARTKQRSGWFQRVLARPAYAAGLAAVLVVLGVAAGALVGTLGDSGGDTNSYVASVDTERTATGATAKLVSDDNGAHLHVSGMPQPVDQDVYEVWVSRGGKVSPVSLFDVNDDGDGVASIPESLDGADAVMVTREPRGGSDAPTEDPVVAVSLQ